MCENNNNKNNRNGDNVGKDNQQRINEQVKIYRRNYNASYEPTTGSLGRPDIPPAKPAKEED